MPSNERSWARLVARGMLVAMVARPTSAAAQTRFAWPDTAIQFEKYSTADECLAAVQRIRSRIEVQDGLTVWRDTMPPDLRQALAPEAAPVIDAAVRCAAPFAAPVVDIRDFGTVLELFLAAGRDSDAAKLIERRLATAKNAPERSAVADSVVATYLAARPARIAAAEAILLHRAREASDRIERLRVYHDLMAMCAAVGDTIRTRRAAQWVVGVGDSITPQERQSVAFESLAQGNGGQSLVFDALETLIGVAARLDSLRKSTAALVALERGIWSRASGERPEALQIPIGKRAPALTADFWLPLETGRVAHPTAGRVALVVFLDDKQCIESGASDDATLSCPGIVAQLRRYALRFPALEITIVMPTHGSFMYVSPPTPGEEAAFMRQWLDAQQLQRVALGVTATSFWRLADPDGRRIEKDIANLSNYSFAKDWRVGSGSMFLTDTHGIIVDAWRLREDEMAKFIEVLLRREHQVG